jgi:hypothetical protein
MLRIQNVGQCSLADERSTTRKSGIKGSGDCSPWATPRLQTGHGLLRRYCFNPS